MIKTLGSGVMHHSFLFSNDCILYKRRCYRTNCRWSGFNGRNIFVPDFMSSRPEILAKLPFNARSWLPLPPPPPFFFFSSPDYFERVFTTDGPGTFYGSREFFDFGLQVQAFFPPTAALPFYRWGNLWLGSPRCGSLDWVFVFFVLFYGSLFGCTFWKTALLSKWIWTIFSPNHDCLFYFWDRINIFNAYELIMAWVFNASLINPIIFWVSIQLIIKVSAS